ncbi:MAG: DUF2167 domain-containing protein [Erythrobacter sp.]|nr:MAG: DUF2167 domain-containing protein [Erythrobacter sp.]
MRLVLFALLALLMPALPAAAQTDTRLSPQSGTVALADADAELALGTEFDFYDPADARTILVDLWENPPSEAEGVLGIIMPAGASPHERSWGAIITWEPVGWVASDDARDADYDAMLAQMQADARALNRERRAQGYPEVQVLGWAQQPRHDSVANTVAWARELRFFDGSPHALHYDMRLLGRRGVLSMNMVGEIDQLGEIRAAAGELARRTQFNSGARYEDFDAERDEVASYGVAGLVATGVGVAVAKNLGALALLGKLAQPIGIALLVLAAALVTPFRRWFGSRRERSRR